MKRAFGAAIVGALFMLGAASNAAAQANCQGKLFDTAWDCKLNCTFGIFTDCVEFGNFGVSSHFDMIDTTFLTFTDGCACSATGSETAPKFNASATAFQCTEPILATSFVGKVGSKTLKGQFENVEGDSCLYACKKRLTGCM
jgi:hypothetical protein